ncbi:glycosyltransferase family 2 protein [Psychromonas sp. RZ22]|uniref:glycosyltransferase family 2 protein n=1 Tax=Psychromonas algarum TaxID=2555643 RepID=UPI001067B09A|nr:glycosyltransferase family 2 protein [Psychromonas sp. RZ22]TEW56162.1 glycosyltransferase family 2 protein [Psychromonas sp. RZ22]
MSELKNIIIIPCLNEIMHIELLLNNLSELIDIPIIVVDGGSSDGTQAAVMKVANENPQVKLLKNPKKIQSAAINLAVQTFALNSEFFIRLDAHGDYPDDFVMTLINEVNKEKSDSVVVTMDTVGSSSFQSMVAIAQNSKLGNGGSAHRNVNHNGKWVEHGHHALMRVSAFLDVGGYDESFIANEDAELDFRLVQAGYKIWLTAETNMKYYPRNSITKLAIQYYRYGLGRASNALKHKQIPKLRQLIPLSVFPCFLMALLNPLNILTVLPFISWLILCLGYGVLLALKNKNLILVLSGGIIATMHMGWSIGFCKKLLSNSFHLLVGKLK